MESMSNADFAPIEAVCLTAGGANIFLLGHSQSSQLNVRLTIEPQVSFNP
jgi:hypothetical protein